MGELEPREERTPQPLPPIGPVDWRTARQGASEYYLAANRVRQGANIAEHAQAGVNRIRARMTHLDELELSILAAYGFGAARLIEEYMSGR